MKLSTKRPVMLVVDDDPFFCAQVSLFSADSFEVLKSYGGSKVDVAILLQTDIVVLDLVMPDEDGIVFLQTLAALSPRPKLLIASGCEQPVIDMAVRTAKLYGMTGTIGLQKPIVKKIFTSAVAQLLSQIVTDEPTVSAQTSLRANQNDILTALRAGEIIPFYQVQVDITNNRIVGIEALARWDHPMLGIRTPENFIETLELPEIAAEFTMLMMESAMADYAKLVAGTGFQGRLSINVPPNVCTENDFANRVLATAQRLNFPAEKLICEITEREIDNLDPGITATLTRLKMYGVQLSMDDFGTGQSGLSKIKHNAFDEIKIDRTFVKDLTTSLNARLIVENVYSLAEQTMLRVVAEGIEDEKTLTCIKRLGCTIVQGFYYSKPIPLAKLITFIAAWPTDEQDA
jgi:EAL domain-containing protein (putative c-di-GMP-specific phosphodiesterase class I)/CheY-like chemotaxis protein